MTIIIIRVISLLCLLQFAILFTTPDGVLNEFIQSAGESCHVTLSAESDDVVSNAVQRDFIFANKSHEISPLSHRLFYISRLRFGLRDGLRIQVRGGKEICHPFEGINQTDG
jgi:hypothetical protein